MVRSSDNPAEVYEEGKGHHQHVDAFDDTKVGKDEGWEATSEDARQATILEHSLTLRQALKTYPKAVAWSVSVSLAVIMEGYDQTVMGNLFGYPSFQMKYGNYYPGTGYQVSGPWQVGIGNASLIGTLIGAFLNGYLTPRFGYRRVLLASLVALTGFIFIVFFAPDIQVFLVGEMLCGIPFGIFATIVCPLAFRSYLTAYTNLCFAVGQFIASGVLQGLEARTDQWSYRIPFAIQWVWPPFLIALLFFAPESPWWLVRKGRLAEAEHSVERLSSKSARNLSKQTVAMMVHTDNLERELESGTSYWSCLKGSDLRRTEISCVSFAGQILSGSLFGSGTYFFEQAGMDAANAYKLSLGATAISLVGTIISWYLMNLFGRRTIYITGMSIISVVLFIIALVSFAPSTNVNAVWAQSALTVVTTFVYALSIGPVGWTIPSEMSSTRLRGKTLCLARSTYYVIAISGSAIEPYMMNPTEWNWKGKTGFFWAVSAAGTAIWAYYRLPETKARTFEELDILFAKRVSARNFKSYAVDAYEDRENWIRKEQ